ncbi:uncharacterized protein LOC127284291 [Leptopilina boulardi]|uniref:uncharacterized protein LOC127284291 n=1 Tax=Leptopilina boulardi TaxID=63433 RepID=UPI0021F548D7|nr:uncharacterized protein LOC127284291 [Leptopilina boulardi]
MDNVDKFGVKRGRCECGNCPSYCFSKSNLCSYCECVPVKHIKLDNHSNSNATIEVESSNDAFPTEAEVFEISKENEHKNDLNTDGKLPIPTVDERTPYSNLPLDIQEKLNQLSRLIPDSFYENREADDKVGLYSKMDRSEFNKVKRILADKIIKAGCTSQEDITKISSLAIAKFPGLKGDIKEKPADYRTQGALKSFGIT